MKEVFNLDLSVAQVHPTAIVESEVRLGHRTTVWDSVHIRRGASIGDDCIVGEKTYIAYDVRIGDRVKINAFVYICAEVLIENGVMISAGTVFTNDRHPRATTTDLRHLRSSEPDSHTLRTIVREGASIGANCTIGCNLEIGRFAMVGMGAVVTKSVPPFALVFGNPARCVGYVCRCGCPLLRSNGGCFPNSATLRCSVCSLVYCFENSVINELRPPA
jgi:UDP-2-acetamido-3-amino-2,3-dideoxy-glucuronate N-acetyltransferase